LIVSSRTVRKVSMFNIFLFFVSELDNQIEACNKENREFLRNLEMWKSREREHQERINEDAKELEKMTNKQSLLLKKVGCSDLPSSISYKDIY